MQQNENLWNYHFISAIISILQILNRVTFTVTQKSILNREPFNVLYS
uniref:Uncharacterized protein n=1 Tax=Arundo donax TaxID=35708 RepID=A0A0A8Z8C5_ARUDO